MFDALQAATEQRQEEDRKKEAEDQRKMAENIDERLMYWENNQDPDVDLDRELEKYLFKIEKMKLD